MNTELRGLERDWLEALQQADTSSLDRLLDEAFVCKSPKSSGGLLLRGEYLRYAGRRRLRNCELDGIRVQLVAKFALIECYFKCHHHVGSRNWTTNFVLSDTWIRRDDGWKALNRNSAVTRRVRN